MREKEEKLLQFLVFNVISTALLKVFFLLARLHEDAKVFEQLFLTFLPMISFKIALITFQRTRSDKNIKLLTFPSDKIKFVQIFEFSLFSGFLMLSHLCLNPKLTTMKLHFFPHAIFISLCSLKNS